MFDHVPENYSRNLALCAVHFTEDSFQNLKEFNAGFNKKLLLKHVFGEVLLDSLHRGFLGLILAQTDTAVSTPLLTFDYFFFF